jgi:hypothetical protein
MRSTAFLDDLRFKVAIATSNLAEDEKSEIFKGFKAAVPRGNHRRTGSLLLQPDIRDFFNQLANSVHQCLDQMEADLEQGAT